MEKLMKGLKVAAEFVGETLVIMLIAALAWLWLFLTPEQMSAEYDMALEQGRMAGVCE